jgi:plastocyanin
MIRSSTRPVRAALAGLAASLVVALVPATAGAVTRTVDMGANAFEPQGITISRGDTVRWVNRSPLEHDVSATAPSGYFSSGKTGGMATDETYTFAFRSAGIFSYVCRVHQDWGMRGTVTVPLRVTKLSGPVRFSISVATGSVASPWKHVVQVRRPGASSFVTIATTEAATVTFRPLAHGTYAFRSKLVRTTTGSASGWSPTASATF